MSFFSDERFAELRELFFESAEELLQAMNDAGLELEKRPGDAEILRHVRRAVHTLKGDSASCGYRELSELAHELEDVLTPQLIESGCTSLAEVVLTAADTFHTMLAAYRNNLQLPAADALRAQIRQLTSEPKLAESPERTEPCFNWNEYERLLIEEAAGRGENIFNIALTIDPRSPMRAAALQLVRNVLHSSGTILALRPEDNAPVDDVEMIEAALATTLSQASLQQKCQIPNAVTKARIEEAGPGAAEQDLLGSLLKVETPGAALAAPPAGASSDARARTDREGPSRTAAVQSVSTLAENTLRVETSRIDTVMNLVGELIIGKSMLHRTINEFDKRFTKDPLSGRFADALAFQSRVLDDLQKSVMKIRMVPVEQLFRRFPRIVRDVAKLRGKDVALSIEGQSTDLDKSILDALAEPLTHLVRNAVDHGIEPPEQRIAAGKPARGTIRLNAFHQGNQVVVEVSDDGRGMDPKKIAKRAVDRGILSPVEAAGLSEAEALNLIFQPGFSTAEEVTEISGRGMGMDVVRSVLDRLKGSVIIDSQLGKGTRFMLMVPLTLASIQSLLFQAGGRLYAVPISAVIEITRISESEIHEVENHEVFRLRNQVLMLVRLHPPSGAAAKKRLFVIVIGAAERKFGLVVDALMGEEELVIKSLEDHFMANDLVRGASILGDGTVVLILNIAAVVSKLGRVPTVGATA